jgi:hypothetical protein
MLKINTPNNLAAPGQMSGKDTGVVAPVSSSVIPTVGSTMKLALSSKMLLPFRPRVKGQKLLGKLIELRMQVQNIGTTTTCNSPLNNPKSITVL